MSLVERIAQVTGYARADIVRVASGQGRTAADWGIAHAIQVVTGRSAVDLMLGHASDYQPAPAETTNPAAVYDPETAVYAEDADGLTSEYVVETRPATPADDGQDAGQGVEDLVVRVHADLASYARSRHVADRVSEAVAAVGSLAEARLVLYRELANHPRTSLFGLHPAPAALAA